MSYAGIIVNSTSVKLDRIFTYKIPDNMDGKIDIGRRVKIPFGLSNRLIDGFVVRIYKNTDLKGKIKSIHEICDDFPLFTEKNLLIIEKMRKKYLATYIECIKLFIPNGIFKGVRHKKQVVLYKGSELEGRFKKEPYLGIYNIVANQEGIYTKNSLRDKCGVSLSPINTMIKHRFILTEKKTVERYDNNSYRAYSKKVLNSEQKRAFQAVIHSNSRIFLLHGVTGSGKTEIYMQIAEKVMQQGKECIILVPEISLTPQMVERFKGRFGKDISVFHSRLSIGERYDEWMRIKKGLVKVAIGARSAIFLPFSHVGLIIVDEEHEESYKSDVSPKYNAREIGEMMCREYDCRMILGSATPSVETYSRCRKGEIELVKIENRADGAYMPEIEIVDMRDELLCGNKSMFSRRLHDLMAERFERNEQVILFLNRRGFSTFVSCRKCGYIFKCSNCDISLTYHRGMKKLVCHYCGSRHDVPKVCPKCGSRYVKYFGVGTEKVEQLLKSEFPSVKTLRMDFDTTRLKNSYKNIYNVFKEHKADVLIGTQMVAKGLDFKDVTLVGVIAADLSLNLPDFRSAERTYQLMTQVSGRAGRGNKKGNVVIQTYNPDNYSIKCSAENDYDGFYEKEMTIRQEMQYPPFSDILLINISSKNENILIKNIQNVGVFLNNMLGKDDKIKILGPCPCVISKIKELFRWQIIIKGRISLDMAQAIKKTVYDLTSSVHDDIKVSMDINPTSTL